VILLSIFVPLKQFLQFLELFLALKINSKKEIKLFYRISPSLRPDPTRSHPHPLRTLALRPARPAKPIWRLGQPWPAWSRRRRPWGVRALLLYPRPYKTRRSQTPQCPSPSLRAGGARARALPHPGAEPAAKLAVGRRTIRR
jgi:hypothetical protein